MSSTEASSGSTLEWFAKNPVIGFLGTLASIIGLLLAVVIYFATENTVRSFTKSAVHQPPLFNRENRLICVCTFAGLN